MCIDKHYLLIGLPTCTTPMSKIDTAPHQSWLGLPFFLISPEIRFDSLGFVCIMLTHHSQHARRVLRIPRPDNVVIIKRKLTITQGAAAETDGEAMDWKNCCAARSRPSYSRFRYSSVARAQKKKERGGKFYPRARCRLISSARCLDVSSPYQIYGFLLKNARAPCGADRRRECILSLAAALGGSKFSCVYMRESRVD